MPWFIRLLREGPVHNEQTCRWSLSGVLKGSPPGAALIEVQSKAALCTGTTKLATKPRYIRMQHMQELQLGS